MGYKPSKILIKKENGAFFIYQNGDILNSFELKEDYQRALELLKLLNNIKDVGDKPIYEDFIFNGISIWSLQQQLIFGSILVSYAKYEDVFEFIFKLEPENIIIDNSAYELISFFEIAGIKFKHKKSIKGYFKKVIVRNLVKTLAFFISILAFIKLFLSKIEVLVYTPNKFVKKSQCDFRFQPVYQYLSDKKISYLEIFHTTFGFNFIKNLFFRGKLAIYLDAFPLFLKRSTKHNRKWDLSLVEEYNKYFFEGLIKKSYIMSENSLRRIKIIKFFLNKAKVKELLAMDDTRCVGELIIACRLNKIKTIGFQHGQFSKYHVGWINYVIPNNLSVGFDKLYAWNNYWKNVLLNYSTYYNDDNVEVGGVLRAMKPMNCKKIFGDKIKILIPFETGTRGSEIQYYLKRLIDLGVEIYFKMRPDLSVQFQLNKYGISEGRGVKVIKDINEEILKDIDAVSGVCTTMLNEMIFYDKPIFVFKTSMDLGHLLIDDNLAVLLNKDFKLQEIVDYIKNYKSKKEIAWPKTEITLEKTLDKIFKN